MSRSTRYKRLIVSGTQTAARLMALTATYFSRKHAVVGLDFSVRFHKPVFADETITVEWTVVAVSESPSMKGDVVEMKGRVLNQAGELAVGGTGRVLVTDQLQRMIPKSGNRFSDKIMRKRVSLARDAASRSACRHWPSRKRSENPAYAAAPVR